MTTQNQTTQQAVQTEVFRNVVVEYAGLNKADRFNKYSISVKFDSLSPEQQAKFENIAFVNKQGEKFIQISSFKKLPADNVILPEDGSHKFIGKNDVVSIVTMLNTAKDGRLFPEQALVKYHSTIEEVQEVPNKFAQFVADVDALKDLL